MRKTYLWLLQLATGVLIAVLLGIHMVLMHLDAVLAFFGLDATDPTAWGPMIERASQVIWAVLYIALLVVVLYHAFYGLRNIILEVTKSAKTTRIIDRVLVVCGIIIFAWSAYVPVALLSS